MTLRVLLGLAIGIPLGLVLRAWLLRMDARRFAAPVPPGIRTRTPPSRAQRRRMRKKRGR